MRNVCSDENSFWEQISWALSMVSELSESVTERLFEALELGRLKYGFSAVNARTKRQSYHKTTKSTKIISEEQVLYTAIIHSYLRDVDMICSRSFKNFAGFTTNVSI